jgi:hypothetical protein
MHAVANTPAELLVAYPAHFTNSDSLPRIVAGWDSHPLKNSAFARRTTIPKECYVTFAYISISRLSKNINPNSSTFSAIAYFLLFPISYRYF